MAYCNFNSCIFTYGENLPRKCITEFCSCMLSIQFHEGIYNNSILVFIILFPFDSFDSIITSIPIWIFLSWNQPLFPFESFEPEISLYSHLTLLSLKSAFIAIWVLWAWNQPLFQFDSFGSRISLYCHLTLLSPISPLFPFESFGFMISLYSHLTLLGLTSLSSQLIYFLRH